MGTIIKKIISYFKGSSHKEPPSIALHAMGSTYCAKVTDRVVSDAELANIQKKRALRRRKGERQDRKRLMWKIYEFTISLKQIQTAQNFYDLDRAIVNYNRAIKNCGDIKQNITEWHIQTIIRFCRIQYALGSCDYNLSSEDVENIYNWERCKINYFQILTYISSSSKLYWNNVLQNYKRASDRHKRIQNIINQLKEMTCREGLALIPDIDEEINNLTSYYQSLL